MPTELLTRGGVKELAAKWKSATNKLASIREASNEAIGQTLQAVEVGATAFGLDYANERWGKADKPGDDPELKVMGFPADAVGAGVLHVGSFILGGKYAEHGHNLADGALACFTARLGRAMGRDARAKDLSRSTTGASPAELQEAANRAASEWARNQAVANAA